MNRMRLHIALALAALFMAGTAAGIAIGRRSPASVELRQMAAAPRAEWVLEQVAAELDLDAAQRTRLLPVVTQAVRDARSLASRQHAERMALIKNVDASILPMLTEAQRSALAKLRAKHGGKMIPVPAPTP